MFIEQLTDNEVQEILELLAKKYDLRQGSCEIVSIFEMERDKDCINIKLTKEWDYHGPTIELSRHCIMFDFDFSSPNLYEEKEENIAHDYRRIMFARFGVQYKKALKAYLEQDKLARIQELNEELEERNNKAVDELSVQ